MDSTVDAVRGYYDENAQLEWDRLEKHPFEFIFTTGMMERYIRPGDSVLDIGGGPGRYSIHYAKMGCRVVLAELAGGNVALAREKAAEAGVTIETHVCDCLELERLDRPQNWQDFSAYAGYSPSYLRHFFRREFGVSPGRYRL